MKKNTLAPRRASTATEVLALIGDDPETLLLAIQLLDRMHATRKAGRQARRRAESY